MKKQHRRRALVARSKGKPLHQGNATRKMILIVANMTSGWYNNRKRCLNYINIRGNGKSVRAKVVDEWDSTMGYDSDHDYQSSCANNIVDASKAVWKALGVPESNWGQDLRVIFINLLILRKLCNMFLPRVLGEGIIVPDVDGLACFQKPPCVPTSSLNDNSRKQPNQILKAAMTINKEIFFFLFHKDEEESTKERIYKCRG
ncbi:hypothetical protein GOBAR_AA31698 [Gossypium barbadense]|uniref:Uncharacterized protein n=1 Tax=Gossypium barbadense TaxID=3634 RepID=A0A2P5WD30_GOSBA|nr:hypothetical protein GOBAR_AA31698 [Gossypium barbadense]